MHQLYSLCMHLMATPKAESGVQLLARLSPKADVSKLDTLLCPWGYKAEDVIELVGEEGTGKTEYLLHTTANAILPEKWKSIKTGGIGGKVVYIDTDFHFSISRLVSMLEARLRNSIADEDCNPNQTEVSEEDIEHFIKSCLDRLHILHCCSSVQLYTSLHSLEGTLINQPDIAVLMIDSISAFYWSDRLSGGESVMAQESCMKKIVALLKKLIMDHKLVLFASRAALFEKRHKTDQSMSDFPHASDHTAARSRPPSLPHYTQYLCQDWHKLLTNKITFYRTKNISGKFLYRVLHEQCPGQYLDKVTSITTTGFATM